ncbi:larval cuticle protein 1-like [Uranotaenia lowii]|uniref:larval cuticle protein 1-like n=1 Tax=Uranotaenia lowii TaxID=190385 RepID=UPI00247B1C83|nr:larval cuticle protein 1-like [Uranotaenia lowii]
MSKFIIFAVIICTSVSCLLAVPVQEARYQPSDVQIVRYENDHNPQENYQFRYALSDDQTRDEVGTLKDGQDAEGNAVRFYVVRGAYSYVGPDGQTHWVHYTADETGFHPRTGTGPEPDRKF